MEIHRVGEWSSSHPRPSSMTSCCLPEYQHLRLSAHLVLFVSVGEKETCRLDVAGQSHKPGENLLDCLVFLFIVAPRDKPLERSRVAGATAPSSLRLTPDKLSSD